MSDRLTTSGGDVSFVPLSRAADAAALERLPYTIRILLENMLRFEGRGADASHIAALAAWPSSVGSDVEIPYRPSRVILQDFTGVPVVADLAAMRAAVARWGGDIARVNPQVPVDLVIDHSVQVDVFGTRDAFSKNVAFEVGRNRERYRFLRWAQTAFDRFRAVPPGMGIVHQVNLEALAEVVTLRDGLAFPDTLVGTDSHTTMIGGVGVLGWGVGGIEAEAAMLGEPVTMSVPPVVGVRLTGRMTEGTTATDLVLAITELLRKHGVVGKLVEFFGPGLGSLSVPDRATVANMSPEYGATEGFFPVDAQTIAYLRGTGRSPDLLDLVERYCKEQLLFAGPGAPEPIYPDLLEFDLGQVVPSMAGPRRPQDRVALGRVGAVVREEIPRFKGQEGAVATLTETTVEMDGRTYPLRDGSVVIAAITSCTNTSNPSVMLASGLLARNAVARGLSVSPTVKTSLAPGSQVVIDYLQRAGLVEPLEQLGFFLVGFGCTTCIAAGTPVLQAEGVARPIEHLPTDGGARLFGPAPGGVVRIAEHSALIPQGTRDCVALTLQDGRTLTCTPDHEILRADGTWCPAGELRPGEDRVVVAMDAPIDQPQPDEAGFALRAGDTMFTMATPSERQKTLAFARLLGHLLDDGSISALGQGRMHVGQAMDREAVLADIELVSGKRPAGTRYDERKWTVVLPKELTDQITALPGIRTGRRIHQAPGFPAFLLEDGCPVAVIREFLGGAFGADGTAPALKRQGHREEDAVLAPPSYAHAVKAEHVEAQKAIMRQIIQLLTRCSVRTDGAAIYEYPVRRAASSYPAPRDGEPRTEVRLQLPDGLSFVANVGFRYSVDKWLRASAASVYWRTIDAIERQRQWMAERLREIHAVHPRLSFRQAREQAAKELEHREPIVARHYSTLLGHDRFSRLPSPDGRRFRPLHRDACGFPSPVAMLREMGAREWFAPLSPRATADHSKRYCVHKESLELPSLTLRVLDVAPAEPHEVFDLSIPELHAFVAGGIAVHNCIGNSGPLDAPVAEAVDREGLAVAAVLSGNRNFEGRVHPQVKLAFLASPPLCVAFAIAGTVDIDLTTDPLGHDPDGKPVMLSDIWPDPEEITDLAAKSLNPDWFRARYAHIFEGDDAWKALEAPTGDLYTWDDASTYIKEPPFLLDLPKDPQPPRPLRDARCLVHVGDSITTDHISPAGSIAKTSPAATYLIEHGVEPAGFNSYGSRRGNHEVMMRGTFANIRLRNLLVPGSEGGVTLGPDDQPASIYDASMAYQSAGVPLVIIAGTEYGSGSSRDWAAKGTALLGVRAVLAVSYERIHRSNLVQMGVVPLQFLDGETATTLGITGQEAFTIEDLATPEPGRVVEVFARAPDGAEKRFQARMRLDTATDVDYIRHGGILPFVLRRIAGST